MPHPPLKISVATVTYNAAALIERTIASVEEQDYAVVEHIIIDGNSTDNTLQAVHHYQERNSHAVKPREITCLSEPDKGLYDAMNKALDLATGQFIVFLNAGDKFHDASTLSRIADVAAGSTDALPGVIYGNTDIVDSQGHFLSKRRLAPPEHLSWRSFRRGMVVCHQAFFANVELARANHYNLRYRFSSDFDWCIRIMRAAQRQRLPLLNAHIVVADYLSEGLTTQNHRKSLFERFAIMCRHYGLILTLLMHAFFCFRAVWKK